MLQKNVLDYLDSSAARFPHKLAFADEARSFTFGQLRPAPGAWAPRWPIWVPSTTGPWRCWSTTPRPTWPPSLGCWKPDISMSPWTFKCLCPGLRGILETLSPAALVYPAGEETLAQALADLCPVLCAEEGFAHPPQDALLDARRGRVLDIDPVYAIFTSGSTAPPRGSSSPTAASLTSPSGWPTPVSLPTRT